MYNYTEPVVPIPLPLGALLIFAGAPDPYTRSPLEDSRLFGPSPWKILAATSVGTSRIVKQTYTYV